MQLFTSVASIQTRRLLRLQLASFHGITLSSRLMRHPHGFRLSGFSADDEQGDIEFECPVTPAALQRRPDGMCPACSCPAVLQDPAELLRALPPLAGRDPRPAPYFVPRPPGPARASQQPESQARPRLLLGMFRRAATPLACSQLNATERFIRIAMAALVCRAFWVRASEYDDP